MLSILLAVAVVLAIGVSVVIIRSVLLQLGKDPGLLAQIAERVIKGDFAVDDGSPKQGVYGNIVNMVDALRGHIDRAHQESARAQEETLKAREATHQAEEASTLAQAKTAAILDAATRLEGIGAIVSSALTQLAAQIEQSERGASEQAARVAETATAMEEMNSTVLEVARNAGAASDVSVSTRQKAEAGAAVVLHSVQSIQAVQEQALKLRGDMVRLDENARAISQIMSVISDIADQTNLLALNAAIEAARAGEAGRGFAVVADEVRKLAEKTMASTTDVGNAIRSIQQSVAASMNQVDSSASTIEEATNYANQSGEALKAIVSMIEHSADQVRAIATASEEQSATSEEINRSLAHVNTIAAETARAMAEASQAVSDLASQSHVLTGLIEEMKQS